jgi:hypothetical protein
MAQYLYMKAFRCSVIEIVSRAEWFKSFPFGENLIIYVISMTVETHSVLTKDTRENVYKTSTFKIHGRLYANTGVYVAFFYTFSVNS